MHRIRQPDHRVARGVHRGDQGRQPVGDRVGAHPGDQREPARVAARVQGLAQGEQLVGGHGGSDLAGHRVEHLGEQGHMGAVDLAGAFTDPRQVGGAEEQPVVLVPAQHRHLVVEQQRLVAGPHRRLDAAGLRAALPAEVLHDVVGGHVAGQDAQRVVASVLRVGLRSVHHVAPVRGEFDAVDHLGGLRTGLGELAGDPSHPYDRLVGDQPQRAGQQVEDRGLAGHGAGRVLVHVLGAVPGLDDHGVARGDPGQRGTQGADVGGAGERRAGLQGFPHPLQLMPVAPVGLLQGLE